MSTLQQNYSIIQFTLGSLDTVGYLEVIYVVIASFLLYTMTHLYKTPIKLLLISNDTAFLKGTNVHTTNIILLIGISACVGISISFVGPIGFVGLVIPHMIKLLYKKSYHTLFFPVFYYGGIFLVISDLISRNLNTASAIPIGVVTAFIGAPFFIYLLMSKKRSH